MEFQDPEVSIVEKVKYIENRLSNDDEEVLGQLIGEYEFSQSLILFDILEEISISPVLVSHQKYLVLETMYSSKEVIDSLYRDRLEKLIASYVPDSPVLEFVVVKWLFSFGNGLNHIDRLYKYLGNAQLQDITRYNQVFSLREIYPEETTSGIIFLFSHHTCGNRCKVMCSQYLLENEKENYNVLQALFKIAEDKKEDYNIRADAADAIHHYTTGEEQEKALNILRSLGGNSANLYEDKQNVHIVDISEGLALIEGIRPILEFHEIAKLISRVKDPKVAASLGRIIMDTARYGNSKIAFTSEEIIERVWAFISSHENKEALIVRLIEELRDMADTCSSGHALRLINVMSGFGANVRISFVDQIASSFEGRMNALIRNIKDEYIRNNIYNDMVDKGPSFMSFFNKNQKVVIDELYKEYVEGGYIDTDEFDMGILKALKPYEGRSTRTMLNFNIVRTD